MSAALGSGFGPWRARRGLWRPLLLLCALDSGTHPSPGRCAQPVIPLRLVSSSRREPLTPLVQQPAGLREVTSSPSALVPQLLCGVSDVVSLGTGAFHLSLACGSQVADFREQLLTCAGVDPARVVEFSCGECAGVAGRGRALSL